MWDRTTWSGLVDAFVDGLDLQVTTRIAAQRCLPKLVLRLIFAMVSKVLRRGVPTKGLRGE
jgi:hypothetical protein